MAGAVRQRQLAKPPASLPVAQITNDDAVTVTTKPVIMNMADDYTNPNGCKLPVT